MSEGRAVQFTSFFLLFFVVAFSPLLGRSLFGVEGEVAADAYVTARHGAFAVRVQPGWSRVSDERAGGGMVGWYRIPAEGPAGAKMVFMVMPAATEVPSVEKLNSALAQMEKTGSSAEMRVLSTAWTEVAGRRTLRVSESADGKTIRHTFVIVDGLRIYMACGVTENLPATALAQFEPWVAGLSIAGRLPDERLLIDVILAREEAQKDYRDMLLRYATPEVTGRFKAWDEELWPATDPQRGWAYFFKSALVVFGPGDAERGRVSFYHPWSDVALITNWTIGETATLVGAQVWPGDALRKDFKPPFDTEPGWVSSPVYRPAAVLKTTAETCAKLEAATRGDIPEDVQAAGRYGAALALATNIGQLAEFMGSEETRPLREELVEMTRRREAGEFGVFVRGLSELPEGWRVPLSVMPKEVWNRLRPAGFLRGEKTAALMMVRLDAPDQFASFIFRKQDDGWRATDMRYYAFPLALPELQAKAEVAP